jgi:hypothetical protein
MTSAEKLPLSNKANQSFEVLPLAATAGDAVDKTVHHVLVDANDRPAAVLDPETLTRLDPATPLSDIVHTLPTTIVVDAAERSPAVLSWAFSEADRDSSVVFTNRGAVVGVWSGPTLVSVLARTRWRVNQDVQLPGTPGIAAVARTCRFSHADKHCAEVVHFAEYPESSSPCPNGAGLPAHDFEW